MSELEAAQDGLARIEVAIQDAVYLDEAAYNQMVPMHNLQQKVEVWNAGHHVIVQTIQLIWQESITMFVSIRFPQETGETL